MFLINSKRPRVQTDIGFSVDGSSEDRTNFGMTLTLMADGDVTSVKDADNIIHENVTRDNIITIINAISLKQKELLEEKWAKDAEIDACNTVDELKALNI